MSLGKRYPTPFQRKTCWIALTSVAVVAIGAVFVGAIGLVSWVLGFLQPVLVPIVAAGILAYLLEPVIEWLEDKWPRRRAEIAVYFGFLLVILLLAVAVVLPLYQQGIALYSQWSEFQGKIHQGWKQATHFVEGRIGEENYEDLTAWWLETGPDYAKTAATWLWGRVLGVVGLLGYLIGIFLIPIYLYFFLKEGTSISRHWSRYLPLKESKFKDEFVATVEEINSYLIAFFRGQLVVSMIDGFIIGVILLIIGLPYAFLIGVFVAILGLIPYLGNLLCLIPAMLIAWGHFGDPANTWDFLPQIWAYPLIVLGVFVIVQQINGLVTAPKIVGDSVGLHPLTVIFSVFFWTLILGGILGALLAVPLTASLKVLLRRFVWERRKKRLLGEDNDSDPDVGADSAAPEPAG